MGKVGNKGQIKERLRTWGYKATSARLSILGVLEKSPSPLSAQAIIDRMKGEVDPATVYRNIKALRDKGVIRPIDFRHNHAHYELETDREKKRHHHHLICTKCGASEDISYCDVELLEEMVIRKSKSFSAINQHSLEFYGICDKCSKK